MVKYTKVLSEYCRTDSISEKASIKTPLKDFIRKVKIQLSSVVSSHKVVRR